MRISAKGRYGLAAMAYLAQRHASGTPTATITISDELGISKIYLEQVFSLLKRAGLVDSIKGAQGGYILTKVPRDITAFDILSALELGLIEKTASACSEKKPALDRVLKDRIFDSLDFSIRTTLSSISLEDILDSIQRQSESPMYFI